MKLRIWTPYGESYDIDEHGCIYGGPNNVKPSGKWLFLGLSKTDASFGRIAVQPIEITPDWLAVTPLLYKNGKPRFTVCDLDHGTRRTWGNTASHGVQSIEIEE